MGNIMAFFFRGRFVEFGARGSGVRREVRRVKILASPPDDGDRDGDGDGDGDGELD